MSKRSDDIHEQEQRDDLAAAIKGTPKIPRTKMSKLDRLRRIVEEKQAARVDGLLVDLFTASAIVKVHDALNEENRAKFVSVPVRRMASIAFKLIEAK